MKYSKFVEWAFLGIISGGVVVLWQMKESVSSLNTKIEVMVVNQLQTKNEVSDHELRLRKLETK